MRIGWIGVHAEGIPALEAVAAAGYQIAGVMTLRSSKADRRCGSVDYHSVCRRLGVPVAEVDHVNDATSIEQLRNWNCDLLVVLGWGQILGPDVLNVATLGVVGAHASFLPHNRGSAPVNWAIINGETTTGNSLMWLSEGVDSGDLIDQRCFSISPYDTCATIYEKVAESNRDMLLQLLSELRAGRRPGRSQPHSDEPLLPRRRPEDGQINWHSSSTDIYNLVRGVTRPYPGAFTFLSDGKWWIWNVAVLPPFMSGVPPGTVLGPVRSPEQNACGQMIATTDGAVVVLEAEDAQGRVYSGYSLSELDWSGKRVSYAA